MATAQGITAISKPLPSCIRCANRKVKCDRQRPCSGCARHNVDCIFPPSELRKGQKRIRVQSLTEKIRHYEALLRKQGIDLDRLPDTPNSNVSGTSTRLGPGESMVNLSTLLPNKPEHKQKMDEDQLLPGQVRYNLVDNTLWTRVLEESHDPENTLEDSVDPSDNEASPEDFSFMFRQSNTESRPRHPKQDHIHRLWRIYTENIDPLTKVVHIPTLQPAVYKAASAIETVELPRAFEALMFAIYSTAVMSLKDDECTKLFSEPRRTLLSRYIASTEAALARAHFMSTTSLIVLQAMILHLISVRDTYDPRAVWTFTGVALRIAEGLGLDRDGTFLGLPVFETEVRRRVWWQLKSHDFRAAEMCGFSKFRGLTFEAEGTKWPTNVSDDQLYPGMLPLVAQPNGLTDFVFVAFRYDLIKFAATRVAKSRQEDTTAQPWQFAMPERDKSSTMEASKQLEDLMETKYMRYCDPSQPLHLLIMLVGRYGLNAIRFLANHPRGWSQQTPASEREFVWDVSIKLLEQQDIVLSNPLLEQFAWHAPYFRLWHAFIHVLDVLRAEPERADAEKTWHLIGKTYQNTPEMTCDMKKPIHAAVGSLCLKAYSNRETAFRNKQQAPPPTMEFILKLRQQLDVAKAKRRKRSAKRDQQGASTPRSHAGVVYVGSAMEGTHLQQSPLPDLSPPGNQNSHTLDSHEMFYLGHGFDENVASVSDMDLDLMLMKSFPLDNDGNNTWDQWDSWLADSNLMRSH